MENKLSNIWKCFLPSVCIFVLQMAISFVGMFFVFCYKAHTYTSGSFSDFFQGYYNAVTSTDFNVGVMLVYAAIAAVLFFFWYYKKVCDKSAKKGAFALLKANPATCIVGVILLSFGMQYLCTYLMNVVSVLFPSWLTQYETLMDGMGLSESLTLPLVLYTVVIGPICEELTFRGLTFSYARRVMPFWAANVVQALLFAGMHMSFNAVGVLSGGLALGGNGPMQFFCILFGSMVATYLGILLLNKNAKNMA